MAVIVGKEPKVWRVRPFVAEFSSISMASSGKFVCSSDHTHLIFEISILLVTWELSAIICLRLV